MPSVSRGVVKNPHAVSLKNYKQQIVKPKKGKGSYTRKKK